VPVEQRAIVRSNMVVLVQQLLQHTGRLPALRCAVQPGARLQEMRAVTGHVTNTGITHDHLYSRVSVACPVLPRLCLTEDQTMYRAGRAVPGNLVLAAA